MVEQMRAQVQAQIDQSRVYQEKQNGEMQNTVGTIAAGLDKLTKQLNVFKPASSADVEGAQK